MTLGSMANARRALAKEQYDKAIGYLDQGEIWAGDNKELRAKIARLRGECLEEQGRLDDARGVYEHLAATYPDTPEAAQSKIRVAQLPVPAAPNLADSDQAEPASKLR